VLTAAPVVRGAAQALNGQQQLVDGRHGHLTCVSEHPRFFGAVRPAIHGSEELGAAKVALLGQTVSENLFGAGDPVGQTIRIKNVPFRVVRIARAEGPIPFWADQDDVILMPLSTAKFRVLGASHASSRAVGWSWPSEGTGPG